MRYIRYILSALYLFTMIVSCKKEKQESPELPEENKWILDSMRVYYYWNETLPKNPLAHTDATAFYKSLLHPSDRFSSIENPGEIKTEYSSFAYYGIEYALVSMPGFAGRLIGVITLVVPGSSGFRQGLKRGDFFSTVNDKQVSTANAPEIIKILKQGNGIRLRRVKIANNQMTEKDLISIPIAHFKENPVYVTRVFGEGLKKIGYIFYNYFDGASDQKLLDSLAKFRSSGISELILDMRYNPGGDVSSAAKIAAVLAPVRQDQLFIIYQANKNGGRINSSFQQTIKENSYRPNDFELVKDYRLNLNRVIVLTTGATASSAEVVVNCLKPYVEVVQIGQTTIGKDMASFAVNDQRNPKKINYVLHPLVFKLYNARSEGNYESGLVPDYMVDEFSVLPLKLFGSEEDPLVRKALELSEVKISTSRSSKTLPTLILNEQVFGSAQTRSVKTAPVITRHFHN